MSNGLIKENAKITWRQWYMIGQVKQVIRRKKCMLGYAIPPSINETIFCCRKMWWRSVINSQRFIACQKPQLYMLCGYISRG